MQKLHEARHVLADARIAPAHDRLVAVGKIHADLFDDRPRPLAHDEDAVRERDRLDEVVGDEKRGLPFGRERLREVLLQDHLGLRVERRERLIQEQHQRIDRERARERRALAHAARELVRVVRLESREVALREQRRRFLAALGRRHAAELEAELGVLADGAPGKQQILLQHEGDVRVRAGDGLAGHADVAAGGEIEARAHVEQRRLAAAARADE